MKKSLLLVTTLLISLFVLVGCESKDNELVGTWKGHSNEIEEQFQTKVTFIFENEGKVTYISDYGTNVVGKYKIKDGNTVTIDVSAWDKAKEFKFKIYDGKMDLIAQDDHSQSYVGLEED